MKYICNLRFRYISQALTLLDIRLLNRQLGSNQVLIVIDPLKAVRVQIEE